MSSLVSILIPNYNKAKYLRETLDSVLAQTYKNWECIIVDDHSTDNSWETLKVFGDKDFRFKIFKRPSYLPKGGNSCRNYAFSLSSGEFIQWFDSDDIMNKSLLEKRVEFICSRNNIDFIFSPIVRLYKENPVLEVVHPKQFDRNFLINSFLKVDPAWVTQCCLIKKEFLIKKGIYWDEKLSILQDVFYDLLLIYNSSSYSYHDNVDWNWYIHDDGNNVGAGRTKRSNIFSLYYFLYKSKKILNFSEEDFSFSLKLGYIEIVRSSFDLFGMTWWYFLILKFQRNSIKSIFFSLRIFFLIILFKVFKLFSNKIYCKIGEYSFHKIKNHIYNYY